MRFTRVTLFFIAFIITMGFYQLARHFLSEVEPQTFQATEEVMVDIAHLLAESVEQDMGRGGLRTEHLRETFADAHRRKFEAQIFEHRKTAIGINVYLTDENGIVIFDSDGGRREGEDYSGKRDVALTFLGNYGARSSRDDPADPLSSILYVAAPVGDGGRPDGVLTVFKPQADVLPLIRERKRVIYMACGMIGGGILFLIAAVFLWLFRPIGRITEYARAIERGERPPKPRIGIGREVNALAKALDSMRDALEGRKYAEHYIQTLTHEMKSPLAAIRGAAELLDEEMPLETRKRFLQNIVAETSRSERLINRLLELSAIESRSRLEQVEVLDFRSVVASAVGQAKAHAEFSKVELRVSVPEKEAGMKGDRFLLRAAVLNLLENAIDFAPKDSVVEVTVNQGEQGIFLEVRDRGPGVPDYAKGKVFERFYSLRHHSIGRKGTGLGLTLVKEAAELHGGGIRLEEADGGGTRAILTFPAD